MAKTSDALDILNTMIGDDPKPRALIEEETINLQIARMIYDARKAAGLSQKRWLIWFQQNSPSSPAWTRCGARNFGATRRSN